MGIGTSIFLIAAGAILRYAVNSSFEEVELGTVGLILMIVGVLGLIISGLYMTMWRDRGRPPAEREVVRDREYR